MLPSHAHSSSIDTPAPPRRRSLTLANTEKANAYPPAGSLSSHPESEAFLSEGDNNMGSSGEYSRGRYGAPTLQPHKPVTPWYKRKRVIASAAASLLVLAYLFSGSVATPASYSAPATTTAEQHKAGSGVKGQDGETEFEGIGSEDIEGRPDMPVEDTKGECQPIKGKKETQWALMIDAGSTGSRIHIYEFGWCAPPHWTPKDGDPLPTLKQELFFQLQPGLSSFRGRPQAAADSLKPLLEEAIKAVPKSEQHCTPVAVKATAGLRLLGKKDSDAILARVRAVLESDWPFPVISKEEEGVAIMEGKDEGVYAWITINYLLGLIGPNAKKGESAAVMDLGGASTQIVFEPSFESDEVNISPGDHVYELSLPSGDHTLYQHSHLGYGLMQARRSVHNLIAFTYVWQAAPKGKVVEWEDLNEKIEIPHPCMVKGGKKRVELDPPGRKTVNVTFVGTGAGFEACRRVVDVIMAKDALCEVEPCAFGGVYQPKLMETFGSGPIYALSYFYDRIIPLGIDPSQPFSIADLRTLTTDVCMGPEASSARLQSAEAQGWTRFEESDEAMAELKDRPEYCLDLSFMYSLLSLGYELAEERTLRTGKKIDGVELGWTLGAAIAMLGGHLECTA